MLVLPFHLGALEYLINVNPQKTATTFGFIHLSPSCYHHKQAFFFFDYAIFIVNVISSKPEALSIKHQNLLTTFPPCLLPCLLIFSCPSSLPVRRVFPPGYPPAPHLHLKCHGFFLHKGTFCDAIDLRYVWSPQNLPSNCVCAGLTPLIPLP